jgi:threonyl-tRNA synthetase
MGLTRGRPGPQMAQYNYFLVVGAQEVENGTVTVRIRSQAKVPSTPTD